MISVLYFGRAPRFFLVLLEYSKSLISILLKILSSSVRPSKGYLLKTMSDTMYLMNQTWIQ